MTEVRSAPLDFDPLTTVADAFSLNDVSILLIAARCLLLGSWILVSRRLNWTSASTTVSLARDLESLWILRYSF